MLATGLDEPSGPATTLVTLVVDAPQLDAAPRGSGMLVAEGAQGIHAKAVTHSSAKWPWLAEALPDHRHVLRLSYAGSSVVDDVTALGDAGRMLGVTLDAHSVLASARIEWVGASTADPTTTVQLRVGEGVAGTGLAAVIHQARELAEGLLEEVG